MSLLLQKTKYNIIQKQRNLTVGKKKQLRAFFFSPLHRRAPVTFFKVLFCMVRIIHKVSFFVDYGCSEDNSRRKRSVQNDILGRKKVPTISQVDINQVFSITFCCGRRYYTK